MENQGYLAISLETPRVEIYVGQISLLGKVEMIRRTIKLGACANEADRRPNVVNLQFRGLVHLVNITPHKALTPSH